MSFFSGYSFFVALIILLIPAAILGFLEKRLTFYRWVLSAFFIYKVYGSDWLQLLYLLSYVSFAVLIAELFLMLRTRNGRQAKVYHAFVFLSILPLVVYKITALTGYSIFGFLGISYICFRLVQVIIESYDGVIKEIKPVQFIGFLLFFPSLSSGPIDRSRRYNEDDNKVWKRDEYASMFFDGCFKIVLGLFYKVVCASLIFDLLLKVTISSALDLVIYAYVYGFYLFFDFAGYSSMAVGASYILGIKMPENFNKPFLSIDIKDFWNRWHISLSTWFRDFIFTRFMVDSARKKRFKNRLTGAAVGLILNMTIMGIWHGIEPHYILYGVYHGIILAIVEIYQKKSDFYKKNKDKKLYVFCSWFVNLNVVMFGFLIFSGRLNSLIYHMVA